MCSTTHDPAGSKSRPYPSQIEQYLIGVETKFPPTIIIIIIIIIIIQF